jgi:hypothetical protein
VSAADFTTSQYGRGICACCGQEKALRRDGKIRHHLIKTTNRYISNVCHGAGELPAEPQPEAAVEPKPPVDPADYRRRLEADADDAKKALRAAQFRFDNLCRELEDLRRAEKGCGGNA